MNMRIQNSILSVAFLLLLVALHGCRAINGAPGDSPADQRATILAERSATLEELYQSRPETKDLVRREPGYAFFSNINVNLLLLSTENGYGVVHDNRTGKDTYMRMGSAGVGLGLGAKDYRAIIVFKDAGMLDSFVTHGWDAGGQADAAAKTNTDGGAVSAGATVTGGVEVYQFTKVGLALQATLQGRKYWRDDKLNP